MEHSQLSTLCFDHQMFISSPAKNNTCLYKKREICMLEKDVFVNFEGKPFNKSVHGRLLSSVVFILSNTYY